MPLLYAPRLKYTTEAEEISVNNYPAMRYRHVLEGETDDYTDDPYTLQTDPFCPHRGQADPRDPSAYIDRVKIVRIEDDARPYFHFHVESRTDFTETTDPRTDPAEIEWYSQAFQNLSERDRHGKTIFNTAGSLFRFAHDDSYWIAKVSKNVTQTPYFLFDYENAINDAELQIDGVPAPKGTVRCNGIRVSPWRQATVNGNRVYYRTCTFLLIHRKQGWLIRKDNVGFEELKIEWRPKLVEEVFVADSGPRAGRRQIRMVPERNPTTGEFIWERRGEREPIMINGQKPYQEQVLDRSGQWVPDPRPEDVLIVNDPGIDYYPPMPFNQLPGITDSPRPRGGGSSPLGF